MRKLLFCGLFFWIFAMPAEAAQGYRGGWCLVANLGAGFVHENCSFRSFEACRAQAYSFGSSSFCRVSGYQPGYQHRPVKKKKRHKPRAS
jgi:hypothetical protein